MRNQYLNGNIAVEDNQVELLLTEQDNKLQAIIEILQIILVNLNDKSGSQANKEQIILIQQALVNLGSHTKQANTLHRESQESTHKSLDALQQENQNLRTYCQQIKQQLKKQDGILENRFSSKFMALQYGSIALLTAVATVISIKFLLPAIDSMLPSKNEPKLQKSFSENPVKTPQKSK